MYSLDKTFMRILTVVLSLVAFTDVANASFQLKLVQTGVDPVLVTDQDFTTDTSGSPDLIADGNAVAGRIGYINSAYGAFDLEISSRKKSPAQLTQQVIAIRNTGTSTSTFEVWLTSDGFTDPSTPPAMILKNAVTTQFNVGTGSALVNGYFGTSMYDTSDGTKVQFFEFTSLSPSGDAVQSGTETAKVAYAGGSYSVTNKVVITLAAGAEINVDITTSVLPTPEPASLLMLGLGAAGFAGYFGVRRKKSKV